MSLLLLLRDRGDSTLALNLDFTTGSLDSRITFTRATTATYYNSSGTLTTAASGEARFDYDPVTLAAKGLLIEEARTNRCLQSQDLSTSWTNTRSTETVNATTSPDGTSNADKLVEDATAANSHFITQPNVPVTTGTAYTFSAYFKAAERTIFRVKLAAGFAVDPIVEFNLTAVTGSASQGSPTSIAITSVGNGWYRCAFTATTNATTNTTIQIFLCSAAGVQNYDGDGVSGLYIWGAQLEAGAFATSYIPTTSAAVTRNADVATMTGTNFSDWYNQTEGTLYIEAEANGPDSVNDATTIQAFVSIDDTTDNEIITIQRAGVAPNTTPNQVRPAIKYGNVGQFAPVDGINVLANNTLGKTAMAYKLNDSAICMDGGTVYTDAACTMPTVSRLTFGDRPTLVVAKCSHIKTFRYYNTRKTDAELVSLTT